MNWLGWLVAVLGTVLAQMVLVANVGSSAEELGKEADELRQTLRQEGSATRRLRPLAARAVLDDGSLGVQCALAQDESTSDL